MNEDNISKETLQAITIEQDKIYTQALEHYLLNKSELLSKKEPYSEQIYKLEKIIKRNKRQGYEYAVIRDEALVRSYKLIRQQHLMANNILRSLDYYTIKKFEEKMTEQFIKTQEEIEDIINVDYNPILKLKASNKIIQEAQNNIKDYYAVLEINADMANYFTISSGRIYRLNKYNNYGILKLALYIDHSSLGKQFNPILVEYNLSLVKIILILFISLFFYLIRTRLYRLVELLLIKIRFLGKYSQEISDEIRRPINFLLLVVNIELMLYIYNNFYTIDSLNKIFNILYSILFTIIIFRILNTVASIHINDIDQSNKKVKDEMVNVAIKIVNFLIMIMGLLLVMHFAGANLGTVLSGLGIGGFAIALAARESLSNFLGTISILMSDMFSQGDWIAVGTTEGIVIEIGLRVTTLRTFDNALISIPNGVIANQDVKNWSKRTIGRRIKMSIGVKYDSKPSNIKEAIIEIRDMLQNHPDIATDKTKYQQSRKKSSKIVSHDDAMGVKRTLYVHLDEFTDSSINILINCFSKKVGVNDWLETKEDIMYNIMDILEKNSLEFAYPSLSIYNETTNNKVDMS